MFLFDDRETRRLRKRLAVLEVLYWELEQHHRKAVEAYEAAFKAAYDRYPFAGLPEVKIPVPEEWTPVGTKFEEGDVPERMIFRYRTLIREVRYVAVETSIAKELLDEV